MRRAPSPAGINRPGLTVREALEHYQPKHVSFGFGAVATELLHDEEHMPVAFLGRECRVLGNTLRDPLDGSRILTMLDMETEEEAPINREAFMRP